MNEWLNNTNGYMNKLKMAIAQKYFLNIIELFRPKALMTWLNRIQPITIKSVIEEANRVILPFYGARYKRVKFGKPSLQRKPRGWSPIANKRALSHRELCPQLRIHFYRSSFDTLFQRKQLFFLSLARPQFLWIHSVPRASADEGNSRTHPLRPISHQINPPVPRTRRNPNTEVFFSPATNNRRERVH